MRTVEVLFRTEQRHMEDSPYRVERPHAVQTGTLRIQGRDMPVSYTGMTWSGFSPSDDAWEWDGAQSLGWLCRDSKARPVFQGTECESPRV